MDIAADVVLCLVGIALILIVFDAALRTFVLPRGVVPLVTSEFFRILRRVFDAFARESKSYETRDRVMALYAPLGLFALVFVWMAIDILGFTLLYKGALGIESWHQAFELSGSSFFTLGF